MTTKITIQDILDCRPCYTREQIQDLAAGRTEWTPSELLMRGDVPAADRVWLCCQLLARRDRTRLVAFAQDCAADAAYTAARSCRPYAADAVDALAAALGAALGAADAADAAARHAADAADRVERQLSELAEHLNACA